MGASGRGAPVGGAVSVTTADQVVCAIHGDARHGGARYAPADDDGVLRANEEIPNLVYSYQELDTEEERALRLFVYLGVGSVGGALWEQEMRVLERISGLEHPALPRLEGGGHIRLTTDGHQSGAAYLRVAEGRNSGNGCGVAEYLQGLADGRRQAMQYLWQLADALAVLHDSRIVHRNLWPGTLVTEQDYAGDPETEPYKVRLARFEMSSMLANLLRSSHIDPAMRALVQRFYFEQDECSRAYAPPERQAFIFGASGAYLASEKGDIFSLGMIAAEWLLGPQILTGPFDTVKAIQEAQQRVWLAVARSSLPVAIQTLLERMLDPQERERWTAHEVTQAISQYFGESASQPDGAGDLSAPYIVVFMPGEDATDKTLRGWGHITEPSATVEGKREVVALIERDMNGAEVLYSPEGAANWVQSGKRESRLRATTVIVGRELLWFVDHFWLTRGLGQLQEIFDSAVVIKYVLEKKRYPAVLEELRAYSLPRRVFKVEPIASDRGDIQWFRRQTSTRPSWRPLTDLPPVRGRVLHSSLRQHLAAMEWYLEYQGALLESRIYPYVRRDATATETVLAWDRDAERARWGRLTGLQLKVVGAPDRPTLADLVASAAGEDDKGVWLQLRSSEDPAAGWGSTNFLLKAVRGAEELVIESSGRRTVPARGWVRLAEDGPSRPALIRQAEARLELERNPALLRQLVSPVGRATHSWDGAGRALHGEGAVAVVDLLENQTMFALQGPPGTGKTEVTSEAIRRFLEDDRGARVLVSAQSHDALDNLAERVLGKLNMLDGSSSDASWLALRVASDRARDSLSETMSSFVEEKVVRRLIDSLRMRAANWLRKRSSERPGLEPVVRAWRDVMRQADLDLRIRLRRGANLVFATTGASTRENLVTYGSPEPFDWVVIEEAARAWPTELALPLVRGTRWTLVGDQAQIGPFSKNDIERFLDRCLDDRDEEVKAMGRAKDQYTRAFETFGSMFAAAGGPTRTLTEQYRMQAPIGEVVSSAFYAASGGLKAMRPDEIHPLTSPEWIEGRTLIWLDTGEAQRAEGFWRNELEAQAVTALVRRITPELQKGGLSLAVLSPYRRQCADLAGTIDRRLVHTIDGFQGREANVVIASLVRDRLGRDNSVESTVGHVAHAPRANVLLSRARDLLVVVGRIEVYEQHAGPHWATVVDVIRRRGQVVKIDQAGLG
jgi:AAA domain/Protein kinase domain